MARPSHPKPTRTIQTLLAILLLIRLTTASSLPTLPLPLPPSNTTPNATNPTAPMNRITCRRAPDPRTLCDFTACIPSLFRLYATPSIHTMVIWDPGEVKQWGPETGSGGCYILVDGGLQRDVFAVESLLGPAIGALSKCFVGGVEGRNDLAKTRVGPGDQWWLSVVLETTGVGG